MLDTTLSLAKVILHLFHTCCPHILDLVTAAKNSRERAFKSRLEYSELKPMVISHGESYSEQMKQRVRSRL